MRGTTIIKIRLHIPEIFFRYGRFVFKAKFYLETEGKGNSKIAKYKLTRVWCLFLLVAFIGTYSLPN